MDTTYINVIGGIVGIGMASEGFITLVEKFLAREGAEFVFSEAPAECSKCSLYRVCVGNPKLEVGRRYIVVEVRKKKHICPLTETTLVVVRVKEGFYKIWVPKRYAVEGLTFEYKSEVCGGLCEGSGLRNGDKVTIIKVYGDTQWKGLTQVLVQRVPQPP